MGKTEQIQEIINSLAVAEERQVFISTPSGFQKAKKYKAVLKNNSFIIVTSISRGKGNTAWNKGLTKETDIRMKRNSEAQLGKTIPLEVIEKIKIGNTGKHVGDLNPAKRPEVRELIRLSRIGKKATYATRKKMSENRRKKNFRHTIATKQKMRETKLRIQDGKEWRRNLIIPFKDTKIEIKTQELIKQLPIGFFNHIYMEEIHNAYQCDFFIPVQKNNKVFIKQPIIIECYGNFMHCNPKMYNEDFIRFPNTTKVKAKVVWETDMSRKEQLEAKGYKVIILWENEINSMSLNDFKDKLNVEVPEIEVK